MLYSLQPDQSEPHLGGPFWSISLLARVPDTTSSGLEASNLGSQTQGLKLKIPTKSSHKLEPEKTTGKSKERVLLQYQR